MLNYARTVADKVGENDRVMHQIRNNSSEQAVDDAVMDSSDAHQNQMMQVLSNPQVAKGFAKVVFQILTNNYK
jgi:type I restriction enzyme R subunit